MTAVFERPQGYAAKRYEALVARRVELAQDARRLRREQEQADGEVERLEHALRAARAVELAQVGGDRKTRRETARLERELAKAQQAADRGRLAEAAVVEQAVGRVDADLEQLRVDGREELLGELEPDALAARQLVLDALQGVLAAIKAWENEDARQTAVMPVLVKQRRPLPPLGLDEVRVIARRALAADVPAPLPHGVQGVSIPTEYAPDPEIRDAARARIRAGEAA